MRWDEMRLDRTRLDEIRWGGEVTEGRREGERGNVVILLLNFQSLVLWHLLLISIVLVIILLREWYCDASCPPFIGQLVWSFLTDLWSSLESIKSTMTGEREREKVKAKSQSNTPKFADHAQQMTEANSIQHVQFNYRLTSTDLLRLKSLRQLPGEQVNSHLQM